MSRSGGFVPHCIIVAPLAAIYALLIAVCGIEAAAIVLGTSGTFAVLIYVFTPSGASRGTAQFAAFRGRR